MGVSFFMSGTILACLMALRDGATPSEERNWMLAAWAAMALAVLSKGLIGIVLPGTALLAYVFTASRLAASEAHALAVRAGVVSCHLGAVVRGGIAGQQGVRAVFLRAGALPALPHQGPRPLPAGLVFHTGHHDRRHAVAVFAARRLCQCLENRASWTSTGICAPGAWHKALPPDALSGGVVRHRVPVLFGLQLQARLLHPADLSGHGTAGRRCNCKAPVPAHRSGGSVPVRRHGRCGHLVRRPHRHAVRSEPSLPRCC